MKKTMFLFLALFAALTLAACNGDDTRSAPVINGVQSNVALNTGDPFDPTAGVTATDSVDGNITADIQIFGLSMCGLVDNVAMNEGSCTIRYEIENSAGLKSQRLSTIVITYVRPDNGDSIIVNGDFSEGTNGWIKGEFEGGAAAVTVQNEELNILITGVSWAGQASPRIHQEGLHLEKGKTYRVEFQARALVPRQMVSQMGQLLPSAPWFVDFMPTEMKVFSLTTEMKTFHYTFTMHHDTTENGSITFELGMIDGQSIATTVFLDNVSITETEIGEDTQAPVFAGLTTTTVPVGQAFDPLTGITANDNVDGNVTSNIVVTPPTGLTLVGGKVTFTEPGDFVFEYTVEDAAGNEATGTRTITAQVFEEQVGNLIVNPDFSSPLGTAWRIMNEEGSTGQLTIENGELRANVTNPHQVHQAFPRVWQEGLTLIAGQTYQFSFEARANTARPIMLAFVEILPAAPWVALYSDSYTYNLTTEMQTFTFTFTVSQATTINGSLMIELGTINEISIATQIFFDNFELLNITND